MPAALKPFNRVTPFKSGTGKITVQFDAADKEPAVIQIYEDIGEDPWMGTGFTAKDFSDALEDIPRTKPIDVRVNTAGGSVWDGMAIKTLFDEWPSRKTASIDGMAASVGSWFMLGADEIRAPKHAQMFVHDAWGIVVGNAADMRGVAGQLEKSSDQIAEIYSRKTGMSAAKCRDIMVSGNGTLMTAEEALEMGFIDRITDDEPAGNFTDTQVLNMRNRLVTMRNSISATKKGGATSNAEKLQQMNREKMIALLNKWGIKFNDKATDDELYALVEAGPPKQENAVKFKNGKNGKHAGDCACDACNKKNEKKKEDDGDGDEDDDKDEMDKATRNAFKAAREAEEATVKLQNQLKAQLKTSIENRVKLEIENDKAPAGDLEKWVTLALNSTDPETVLNLLSNLPSRPPGIAPLNITVGDASSVEDLNRMINKLTEPQKYLARNKVRMSNGEREVLGSNAATINRNLNRLKKFNAKGEMEGPLREMWDAWASGVSSPQNANTMTADLLRQVILSEIMRAFKRQFVSPSYFAHTFQNVPLEGSDFVKVPYYPLDTVASTEFKYANGYVINPNAQTLSKSIFVGGKGDGVASAGSGRKYKGLQFTAYEIRRQPWLNISQLTVMAGEQLAIDVRGDIMGTRITAANFGNAIWTGAAGGFDHTVVTQVLLNAAIKAFWPVGMRFGILAPDYYTTLLADPNLSRFLEAGTDDALRQALVGRLYGFQDITFDALMPIANFIRGGDGTLTAGGDPNSAGFIAYPSAILIATAAIMPPPGVLKKLVAYEQVTDDQTGLTINYQYFGLELNNVDNEIIECTYGSDVGELAALKRLTSQGL